MFLGLRLGIPGSNHAVGGAAAFDPASLFAGTAGGYWDPSDLTKLWKDTAGTQAVTADGDAVARIDDKSGNGNHLLQSTSGSRPLYKTSGGLSWLAFDGNNDFMRATFAMGTTWDRITALRPVATVTNGQFMGGVTANECLFDQTGNFRMYNGTSVGPQAAISYGTDYVVTERWANPCQLGLDNGALGNSPSIAAINPGGLTLGGSSADAAGDSCRFYGGIMINRALISGEITSMLTFLGAKQGRVL